MMKRFVLLTLALSTTAGAASAQQGFAPRDTLDVTRCSASGCERISRYVFPDPEKPGFRATNLAAPSENATAARFQQELGPTRLYLDAPGAARGEP